MSKTVTALFDGHVLQPDSALGLEPNVRYVITIQTALPVAEGDVWDTLEAQTGTLEAPRDWAAEHDHYLYGTLRVGLGQVDAQCNARS